MSRIRCLLWDFGDTLCDEKFIWKSGPEWLAVYETFDDGWPQGWNLGQMNSAEFAAELAKRVPLEPEAILPHMVERCGHIEFHDYTYGFFREHHLPQAIVTVNPDIFSDVIVPLHGFTEVTDTIVASWQEQTLDKGDLCRIALERLPVECSPAEALLIDNKQSCLDSWATHGGAGYLYTTDAQFADDIKAGLIGES